MSLLSKSESFKAQILRIILRKDLKKSNPFNGSPNYKAQQFSRKKKSFFDHNERTLPNKDRKQ